ncbi:MAG TPA: IclR family transcriptional regulator [Trebonia sp.]|jgi:DNA-binding IclR family transcriptional regulator
MGNKQVTDRAGKRGADGFGDAPADGHGAASQVQSVDRALTILDILARHGELGVTEIAASLGVHKSTAFRLVSALEQHRLVEQLSERGKYRLGFGIVRLASATTARMNLSQESRPFCRELATEFNETVNVAVLDTGAAVNIAQEQGQATVSVQNWIGRRTPLHATSSGKVLLAWAAGPQVLEFPADLARYTPHTITSGAALRTELDRVRGLGWACTEEELEIGLNAVAAPIRGQGGTVLAAISISGPSYRLTAHSFPAIAARLRSCAAEISAQLGYSAVP